MENPATWDRVTHLINLAIEEHAENEARPEEEREIGLSLPARIRAVLHTAGYEVVTRCPFKDGDACIVEVADDGTGRERRTIRTADGSITWELDGDRDE